MFIAVVGAMAAKPHWQALSESYTYDAYLADLGKKVPPAEREMRSTIFKQRLAAILQHNRIPGKSYRKGVNEFTDWTDAERKSLYTGGFSHGARKFMKSVPFVAPAGFQIPTTVDWTTKNVLTPIKNQGACGSCWAHAATEAIESSAAINSNGMWAPQPLSVGQMTQCTPNPNMCGGTGGCSGATAELGYSYIQSVSGIATDANYPYTSGGGSTGSCSFSRGTPVAVKVTGYTSAQVNNMTDVKTMIASLGPASIGVDASAWSDYDSGVFDECNGNSEQDLDHGVQVVGYTPTTFKVRNSWGAGWGENGFIRLAQTSQCYPDNSPSDGSGCSGGPSSVTVCGPCGLFYEVSFPRAVPTM